VAPLDRGLLAARFLDGLYGILVGTGHRPCHVKPRNGKERHPCYLGRDPPIPAWTRYYTARHHADEGQCQSGHEAGEPEVVTERGTIQSPPSEPPPFERSGLRLVASGRELPHATSPPTDEEPSLMRNILDHEWNADRTDAPDGFLHTIAAMAAA
jgi:hypothetical protein